MALSLSQAARENLKTILICFSLGNLCFVRRWYDLEHVQSRTFDYYRNTPPSLIPLLAMLTAASILAFFFWLGWYWMKRNPSKLRVRLAQSVFLLILIYPIESVRQYWNTQTKHFDWGANLALWVVEAILATGVIMAILGRPHIAGAARRTVLVMNLLLASLLLDFGWTWLSTDSQSFAPKPSASMLPLREGAVRRVLWLVFDEFDEHIAFDERPGTVHLPEIDHFLSESLSATHAASGVPQTLIAIPSLVCGRPFSDAAAIDNRTLLLSIGSEKSLNWAQQPNVFSRARTLGINAAVAGWYHPYCRVIGDQLVNCLSAPAEALLPDAFFTAEENTREPSIMAMVPRLFIRQWETIAGLLHTGETDLNHRLAAHARRLQQDEYSKIHQRLLADVADARLGLLYGHYPTPHPFGFYDHARHDFSASNNVHYLDNLELVDRTVSELREALEHAGLWESTSVLITGDHGLRPSEWRNGPDWNSELEQLAAKSEPTAVPFILKVAGVNDALIYTERFSNIVAGDLCLALLKGEISSGADAQQWISGHTSN